MIEVLDSNTSHVIVYLQDGFQVLVGFRNSNTSHVIVYRECTRSTSFPHRNSNTSHVIVYPPGLERAGSGRRIQIHLMLLFIIDSLPVKRIRQVFKYISCYCLSEWIFYRDTD